MPCGDIFRQEPVGIEFIRILPVLGGPVQVVDINVNITAFGDDITAVCLDFLSSGPRDEWHGRVQPQTFFYAPFHKFHLH